MSHRLLELDEGSSLESVAAEISSTVVSGGVVLYPSDTVYGLLCRADDRQAVERLAGLKGILQSRPFIMLVTGRPMAEEMADCSDPEITVIMRSRWPGKLTLVLPAKSGCPSWVTAPDGTVALRQPDHPLSKLVLDSCRVPLVSTSANPAGGSSCLDFRSVPDSLVRSVDLAVDAGVLPPSSPSTILKLIRGRT